MLSCFHRGDEVAVCALADWLEHDDWSVREAAALALMHVVGKSHAGAQRHVIAKLRYGTEWSVRMAAVRALGLITGGNKVLLILFCFSRTAIHFYIYALPGNFPVHSF